MVIGAGDMGTRHARHWQAAGAKVLAVCDPDITRAQLSAEAVSAKAVDHYQDLLANQDIQLASICTPTFLHPAISIACLNAGKHVLCEKPIALTLPEAYRMQEAAKRNQRELRIGFMRRFDPTLTVLREKLEHLGAPLYISVQIPAGIRPKAAMHDKNANGGPVIDMLCHHFDMWHELFGTYPQLAYAKGSCLAQDKAELQQIASKAIDTAMVVLEFPQGHVASIHVSWGLPATVPISEHHMYTGPGGLIAVDWDNENNKLSFYQTKHQSVWQEPVDAWQGEIAQFYGELRHHLPRKLADAEDGIRALRLSLEILAEIEKTQ